MKGFENPHPPQAAKIKQTFEGLTQGDAGARRGELIPAPGDQKQRFPFLYELGSSVLVDMMKMSGPGLDFC